jgi:hypothetical protein
MGIPSVYPTCTTVYDPDKCWNGYTLYQAKGVGATVIDMNGSVVKQFERLHGFPNKMLPGGILMGATGIRNKKYGFQDFKKLVQVDWDGNIMWGFDQWEYIEDPGEEPQWMARQHHDYQREGNPVGYYVPGMEPKVNEGNTIILCHKNLHNPKITDKLLLDDAFIEVNWEGEIIWEWLCSDHFEELGFTEEAKNTMYRNPNFLPKIGEGAADWMHINALSALGPNKWHDNGDDRFHPDNLIFSSRMSNIMAIIDKKTGKLVWRLGPDYLATEELRKIRWIIGQHHAHMIPRGLPGEGNILIYDNGGWAGYGAPNPWSPKGFQNALRDYSRVLEIDPVTFEIVWLYKQAEGTGTLPTDNYRFYSGHVSSAQRLPNGNTMITEGANGRIFEVTPDNEVLWEYISPYSGQNSKINLVYRSYRYPYDWIPQLDKPQEAPTAPIDCNSFRVPGDKQEGPKNVSVFEPGDDFAGGDQICVAEEEEVGT